MNVTLWDRTRWDRLQATALVVGIAVASCSPAWLTLAVLTGHLTAASGQ